jgi:hypothetical protein
MLGAAAIPFLVNAAAMKAMITPLRAPSWARLLWLEPGF